MAQPQSGVCSARQSVPAVPSRADRPCLPLPDSVALGDINWLYAVPIVGIHLLALCAVFPYLFSWTGLIVMLLGVHHFGAAINLCYHRQLTHRSFQTPKWLERFFVVMALCGMQDTPAKWVATHRFHHQCTDEQPDPHSPLVSFLWAHVGWLLTRNRAGETMAAYHKYANDILQDPFYMKLEKNRSLIFLIYVAHAALFFLVGFVLGWAIDSTLAAALQFGASLLFWGVFLRTVIVWHITWSVNSITHLFGYRNYETDENSRNNWLVGLFAAGEGWHNNHHHDPSAASNQRRWWEFDLTYFAIQLLSWCRLATNVVPPREIRIANATARNTAIQNDAPPLTPHSAAIDLATRPSQTSKP